MPSICVVVDVIMMFCLPNADKRPRRFTSALCYLGKTNSLALTLLPLPCAIRYIASTILVILAIVELILAAIGQVPIRPNPVVTIVHIAFIAFVVAEDHVFGVLRVKVKLLQVFTFDEAPPELWYKICGKKQRGVGAMLEPNERHKR